jgi:hypothetical protein
MDNWPTRGARTGAAEPRRLNVIEGFSSMANGCGEAFGVDLIGRKCDLPINIPWTWTTFGQLGLLSYSERSDLYDINDSTPIT